MAQKRVKIVKPETGKVVSSEKPNRARIDRLFGLVASKRRKSATIEEINEAIERGWAGEK